MKIKLFRKEAGKFDLLVQHTKPWEGPTVLTKGIAGNDLKAETKRAFEAVWYNGPPSRRRRLES